MNLNSSDVSLLLCVCAAALPWMILCAAVPAQSEPGSEVEAMVAKLDAVRGTSARPPEVLLLEGTIEITFADVPVAGTMLKGKFRELLAADGRSRHEGDYGEMGTMQRGVADGVVWEIDPTTGARVLEGDGAAAVRRYFALLRGASPRELYRSMARAGTSRLDGREHVALRMTPAAGKADTWHVDPETGLVRRIDITLPAPEGIQFVWGMEPEVEIQLGLGDWKRVGGVLRPHRRELKMGAATFTFTCTRIDDGGKLDPARFVPPDAVLEAQSRPTAPAPGKDGYQVDQRGVQLVASVRLKCNPDAIMATLTVVFPEIMQHLNATGARMTGAPFTRYHAFGETEIDLEAGFPVAEAIAEKGRVKNSKLPAGRTLTAWHIGPYEKLGAAHKALQAYAAAQKLAARGGAWEVYWSDPGMVPDPAKWRTQLFLPVEE